MNIDPHDMRTVKIVHLADELRPLFERKQEVLQPDRRGGHEETLPEFMLRMKALAEVNVQIFHLETALTETIKMR